MSSVDTVSRLPDPQPSGQTTAIPTGPPPAATDPYRPVPVPLPDPTTAIAAAVTQAVLAALKSGKLRWSDVLSIVAITLVIAMGVYHEAGNRPYQNALESLVIIFDAHATCSEDSFQALANGETPPKCPQLKREHRVVDRSMR